MSDVTETSEQEVDASTPAPEESADQQGQAQEEESITLDSFDPEKVPADADPQWLIERAKALQADYTRKTQDIAETRREAEQNQAIFDGLRDPNTRLQYAQLLGLTQDDLLQAFGLEMAEPEEPEFEEEQFRDPRVDQLLQQRQQEEAEHQELQQLQGEANHIESELQDIENKGNVEFSDEDAEILTTYARTHPDKLGQPDVRKAYKVLKGAIDRRQQEWIESRKGATPAGATGGVPGSKTVDPSTREGRIQMAMEAAEGATPQ